MRLVLGMCWRISQISWRTNCGISRRREVEDGKRVPYEAMPHYVREPIRLHIVLDSGHIFMPQQFLEAEG